MYNCKNVREMLLELYQINEDGEDVKVEPDDLKITHKTLVIVVSHDTRYVYVFKGSKVSIVQKFASARKASALRLQKGYRIKHVEETEGIDEDFLPILEYLGGIIEDEVENPTTEKSKGTTTQKKQLKPTSAPKKPEPQKKATTVKKTTKKKATTTTKKTKGLPAPEEMPPKLAKVYTAMTALESPKNSSCDYVLIGNKLYLLVGENKNDLSKGKFSFEEVSTLPEGVFSVENYYPRILVSKKKILGVELWARR